LFKVVVGQPVEGVPGGTIDFRKFSKWRVHARLGFIETANLPSVTTLIR
jgi:hypothetical protein